MYLVQAEGVPSDGRGTCTSSSGRKPHHSPGGVPPGGPMPGSYGTAQVLNAYKYAFRT
ncbi:hypothetical protein PGTUg99_037488 [Puccinia graminis f. sp. tritici]|uniref:Uncharacterized protein n=1 Tax=Puccinia graminis f. sp. tritici TaxID=56615 RepID=A0A5B0R603_PUCGR|nr:hypothetical protein PGTUg99_015223 [Puccinia graminis f. sp. tritici]KAA1127527.1 hypothetical protein PGTUg99_037488 [Puccinia graminis f. sp. tritici]